MVQTRKGKRKEEVKMNTRDGKYEALNLGAWPLVSLFRPYGERPTKETEN
jgi:hypothetical protein